MANGHGGKREGAGRPRGSVSERVANVLDHLNEDQNNPVIMLTEVAQKAREMEDWHLLFKVGNALMNYCIPKVKPLDEHMEQPPTPIVIHTSFPCPGDEWKKGIKPEPDEDGIIRYTQHQNCTPEQEAYYSTERLRESEPTQRFVEDCDPYED